MNNWTDFVVGQFIGGGAFYVGMIVCLLGCFLLLELGGNDLLGGASIPKYREDLEKMLTLICRPHRRVAMIELPLPPFYNRFGMVQRDLAKTHGVTLIPKRYFAKIMSTPGATVDGLHLSNSGHSLLAHALFEMVTQPQ